MSDLAATESPSRSKLSLRPVLAHASRGVMLLASVWLVLVGVHKAMHLAEFRDTITSHGILNADAAWLAAPSVAAMEILVGVSSLWLVSAAARPLRAGLMLAAVFLVFACYAAWVAMDPPPAPTSCGCMAGSATINPRDWTSLAIRNVLLAIAAIVTTRLALTSDPRSSPVLQ